MIRNIWEKVGAAFGIGGAVLISMNMNLELIAFSAYLISNVAWLAVAYKKNMPEIYLMSWVYLVITLMGFIRL
jgi:hypothetical protein